MPELYLHNSRSDNSKPLYFPLDNNPLYSINSDKQFDNNKFSA